MGYDDIPEGFAPVSSAPPKPRSPSGDFDLRGAADFGKQWGTVTSTYRTPEHNRRVGGAPNSWHTKARAIDIARAKGVRHRDIEEGYKAAGYQLLESLDEGDHSHFAFAGGPRVEQGSFAALDMPSDIPEGFKPVGSAPPPSAQAPQQSMAVEQPVGPAPYRSQVDPAKNAQLQAAFDQGAGFDDLVKMAGELGIQFEQGRTGPLRGAIAYRDKGGKGARILPMPEKGPRPPLPGTEIKALTTPDEPFGRTIPEKVGNIAYRLGDALGFKYAGRMQREAQTVSEWLPIIGGAAAIEEAGTDLGQGRYGSAAANAALGAIDFIPAAGPVGRAVGRTGKQVIDSAALRSVVSGADGGVDVGKAGEYLRNTADEALSKGGRVTLHVEGRAIPITKPGLVDDADQPWGAMPLLSPKNGDNPRLEIDYGDTSPLSPNGAADDVGAPSPSGERQRDYIFTDIPQGFKPVDEPQMGLVRPMGQQASPEHIAAIARTVRPEDVRPIPSNVVESFDEFQRANPGTLQQLQPPALGRRPKKPADVLSFVRGWVRTESDAKGLPVRIDAEDAIDKGVPAEYIYSNPGVADQSKLRLRNPSIFGTRYGAMSGTQQQLRSLDQLNLDPVEWGHDASIAAGRVEPEDIGDLLRRGFEGDESALHRGSGFAAWSDYQDRAAQRAEFDARFPDNPPVEPRGQLVGLDDLARNDPPATAYEELPRPTGKVGNINLAKLSTRNDIRRLLQVTHNKMGGFDEARRGVQTWEETERLAGMLGMGPKELLQRRRGQALNAEQIERFGQVLAQSSDEMASLAAKADEGSEADVDAFTEAWVTHAAIMEQVSAVTSEAGRAFNILKKVKKAQARSPKIHIDPTQHIGGRDRAREAARAILELQRNGADPGKLSKFALEAIKPSKWDYFFEYYYPALLSGVSTHIVNTGSTLATMLTQIPEFATAAAIGGVRRGAAKLAGSERRSDAVLMSEVGARALGMIQGAKEGAHAFAKVMKTGDPIDPMTKLEMRRHKVIPGMAGNIIRVPTTLLMAEDEFFKAVAKRSAMSGLAVRKARNEGLRGDAAKARIGELIANPTDDLIEQSRDYARYVTFQSKLGGFGQSLTRATETAPPLKLVIPFIRAPINLFKFSIERLPIAQLALKRVRDDYKAGGARRDLAIAKAMMGAGLGGAVMMHAAAGNITGRGPTDPGKRRMMMADGWQPYSVKINGSWYSYSRLDPFATLIGTVADLATFADGLTPKQRENTYTALTGSIVGQIESKTWLSGITDLIQALDEPERFGEAYVSRLAGSLIPTVSAHAAKAIDPIARETKASDDVSDLARIPVASLNAVKSRIPGLSDNLPSRADVWGNDIRNEMGGAEAFLSPFYRRTPKNDPIAGEMLDAGYSMGKPDRVLSDGDGGERRLSDREFREYQKLSAQYVRDDLAEALADPEWKALTPDERKRAIKKMTRVAREDARADLGLDSDGGFSDLPAGFVPYSDVPEGFAPAPRVRLHP